MISYTIDPQDFSYSCPVGKIAKKAVWRSAAALGVH